MTLFGLVEFKFIAPTSLWGPIFHGAPVIGSILDLLGLVQVAWVFRLPPFLILVFPLGSLFEPYLLFLAVLLRFAFLPLPFLFCLELLDFGAEG